MPPPLRLNGSLLAQPFRGGAGAPHVSGKHTRMPRHPSSRRSFSVSTPRPLSSSPTSNSNSTSSSSSSTFTSVSPDEISHFDGLASSWWDPQGPSRILHLMNPLRHDFIRRCRASVAPEPAAAAGQHQHQQQPKLRYLDIGCGGGIFAESAARLPTTLSVTAIDPSASVLAVARSHARRDPSLRGKLTYAHASIEDLPPPPTTTTATATTGWDGTFDVVSVFEVIEHVSSPARFLDRCAPFVRPGGWLVLSTIARTWASWLTTNVVAEDLLRIVPRGTHDWRKYVNEDELRDYFLRGGGPTARPGYWAEPRCMGVVYVPGLGWREVSGSEKIGNYFFAVRRAPADGDDGGSVAAEP
ncbi:S-adenosyl-L-methionine-dependent methyltransferase [Biscogniauxia marginata]|nr:S-adenosyl-L-methionine-dependent methyltransferase [Biscogniauxia marginata]